MMVFFMGLLRHWKAGAVVSVVCGAAGTIWLQHLDLDHQERLLAAARARYALLEQSERELQGAIGRQNAAVAALAEASRRKEKRAADALAQARRQAARYRKGARAVAAMGNGGGDCADLRAIINGYAALAVKEGF